MSAAGEGTLARARLGRGGLSVVFALAFAGLLGSLVFVLAGASPGAAWLALAEGAFGSARSLGEVCLKTAPLTLTGLSVALCRRLGLWNIGAEGQFVCGAVFACWAGFALPPHWPALACLPLALTMAAAGGALAALGPGLLKARLGVSEILTTLMLNYVAILFMEHLYFGPWRDPAGMGFPGTAQLGDNLWLPLVAGRVHLGLPLALGASLGVWFALTRTRFGFEAKVLGLSPRAAAYAGFNTARLTVTAMCLSGALAGLAGAGELLGAQHRLQDGLASGLGMTGIVVAFLARQNALAVPPAAFFLAALLVGADRLQSGLRLPGATVLALQAMLLFGIMLGQALAINIRDLKLLRALEPPHVP